MVGGMTLLSRQEKKKRKKSHTKFHTHTHTHTLSEAHPALFLQTSAGTIRPQACLGWWFDKLALSSRRCALCQWVRVYTVL